MLFRSGSAVVLVGLDGFTSDLARLFYRHSIAHTLEDDLLGSVGLFGLIWSWSHKVARRGCFHLSGQEV